MNARSLPVKNVSTSKHLTEYIFVFIISMLRDFCIPLTMKIMVPDLSLYDAEYLAAIIVIESLVVYTIMGFRFQNGEPKEDYGIPSALGGIPAGTRRVAGSEAVPVDAQRISPALLAQPA